MRRDIIKLDKKHAEGLDYYGLSKDKKTIVVVGGSLGARTLNRAMAESTALLAENNGVQVLWQCGRFYENEYKKDNTTLSSGAELRILVI